MNADTIAAIQAARLDFQALLGRPWAFADSPSINTPAAAGSPDPDPTPAPIDVPAVVSTPAPAPVAAAAPTVPAGWRVMSARFSSRCGSCGGYIAAGDQILYRKGSRALHEQCSPQAAPAPAAPAPAAAATVPDWQTPGWNDWKALPAIIQASQAAAAATPAPAPAVKPAGRGKTRKAAQRKPAAPTLAQPLAPIAWDPDAF